MVKLILTLLLILVVILPAAWVACGVPRVVWLGSAANLMPMEAWLAACPRPDLCGAATAAQMAGTAESHMCSSGHGSGSPSYGWCLRCGWLALGVWVR
jgi:hypothetical protein